MRYHTVLRPSFFLLFVLTATSLQAQVTFRNRMNSAIRVIVSEVGNPTPVSQFELNVNNRVFFTPRAVLYDIQVIPLENEVAGSRHSSVPLAEFNNQEVPLGGILDTVTECFPRRIFRRHCRCRTFERRIATTIEAIRADGSRFYSEVPEIGYQGNY
jgi:hypothetical protein